MKWRFIAKELLYGLLKGIRRDLTTLRGRATLLLEAFGFWMRHR